MSIQHTESVPSNTAPICTHGEPDGLKQEIKMLEEREKWLKSQEKIYEKQLDHLGARWFAYEILPIKAPASKEGPELLQYKKELKNNIKSREEYIQTLVSEINQKTAEIQKCRHTTTYTVREVSSHPADDCLSVAKVVLVSAILAPVLIPALAGTLVVGSTLIAGAVLTAGTIALVAGSIGIAAAAIGVTSALIHVTAIPLIVAGAILLL